jgi:hypothetical protein
MTLVLNVLFVIGVLYIHLSDQHDSYIVFVGSEELHEEEVSLVPRVGASRRYHSHDLESRENDDKNVYQHFPWEDIYS